MTMINHQAILASAGSGKTYQLAHRYIKLLVLDVDPGRIIAITFSRKAAGEIFSAIVQHLCVATQSPEHAAKTAQQLGLPHLGPTDFLAALRRFLGSLHQLHISTMDSFTVNILRAFPLELGIAPGFNLMDSGGPEAQQARRETLAQLFDQFDRDASARRELIECFKQASYGAESKRFAEVMAEFIAEYQGHYQRLPDGRCWGNAERIWPGGIPWKGPVDITATSTALLERIQGEEWKEPAQIKWREFLTLLPRHQHSVTWSGIEDVASRLLGLQGELQAQGTATLLLARQRAAVTGVVADHVQTINHYLMQGAIAAALTSTRALFTLLDQFETLYDQQVRRPGRITFDDAQRLIARGGRGLSRDAAATNQLFIDYRLDSQLDHWLIDEFQDTSDLQWRVFQNLADEILQDPSGTRSFFFVGDVKQAIYAWRGGNHHLFGDVLQTYAGGIEEVMLDRSYRSSAAILEGVNKAFQPLPEELPDSVHALWNRHWREHQTREDQAPPPGYMALYQAGDDSRSLTACFEHCAEILRDLDPIRKGLSVAVLVRQNKTAQRVANLLRARCPGLPVAVDGTSALTDNPVVLVLLSLIQYAAHPGDTLAHQHLCMSPLGRPPAPLALLYSLHTDGYQSFFQRWGEHLDAAGALDDFGRHRLEALIEAAAEFDASGERAPDAFLHFVEGYTIPEQSADTAVRIMTIHKAKGLGFDVVILPELDSSLKGRQDHRLYVANDECRHPDWALMMPVKAIWESDPTLRHAADCATEDRIFENLCALYVALTRAKRACYAIAPPPPQKPSMTNYAAFLRLQWTGDKGAAARNDGITIDFGDPEWHRDVQPDPETVATTSRAIPKRFPGKRSKRRRLLQVSPSARAEAPRAAHLLFMPNVHRSLELGTAVHGLFEQVDWSDAVDVERVVDEWQRRVADLDPDAIAHFRQAMAQPAFQSALQRPAGDLLLWREKKFEAVVEEQWVTGTFDRVVLYRTPAGRFERAEILDFKTNDVSPENLASTIEHYRPQLDLYTQALTQLTQVPPDRIERKLLFTRTGQVIPA